MNKIFFVLIMFIISAVNGQSEWTLDSCINYAKNNNISVQLRILNTELAKLSLMREKTSFLPSISANATHAYNYGRKVDMYTNDFATERVQSNNFYVAASITVFNGFRLINSFQKAKMETEAAMLDEMQIADDISLSVATAYLQVLYATEILNNAEKQIEITQQQVAKNKKLFESGSISKGILLSVEAQEATEESQLVNAQNQLSIAYLSLSQILDIKDIENFKIHIPKFENLDSAAIFLPNIQDIINYAEKKNNGLLADEYRVKIAEKNMKIARSNYYPTLTLHGSFGTGYSGASNKIIGVSNTRIDTIGYTTGNPKEYVLQESKNYLYKKNPFINQIHDNINKSIGLQLNIPIFSNLNNSVSVKQAKINIKIAILSYQQKKMDLQKTIQQSYTDATAAYRRYNATKKQVVALEETFKYVEKKFDIGLATSMEYVDAKNKLLIAKSEMLQAKYEFIFRSKTLDFYRGYPIKI